MGITTKIRWEVRRALLARRLAEKWERDCCQLPLAASHRRLYDIIHVLFWRKFRSLPSIAKPANLNEKIQWLKLFDQQQKIVECVDKFSAKEFAEKRIGKEFIIPTLDVYENPEEIKFASLPSAFVLKTTHDSGGVFLLRDKNVIDTVVIRKGLETRLRRLHGYYSGEWAYSSIRPRILAEQLLGTAAGQPPADYKLHCVNGEFRWAQYITGRGCAPREVLIDEEGVPINFTLKYPRGNEFPDLRPWPEMKRIAEALAAGWKYVLVDLYWEGGRIYFGEMTFYPDAGLYKGEGQAMLGAEVDFSLKSTQPPVFCNQGRP